MTDIARRLVVAAGLLFCGWSGAGAEAPPALTPAQDHAVIDEVARLVSAHYVFPDMRAGIVAELRRREAAGRYTIANPAEFARVLSDDMVAISQDRHMWFAYDPAAYRAALLPRDANDSDPLSDAAALRDNQGYEEMRILPGNVRYVRLSGFEWSGDVTTRVVADVARFLHGADAIILDIAGNGGGSGDAVKALVSYFLPPDGRVLMNFHDTFEGKDFSTRVIDKLDAPRLTGIPLYVLISSHTGSAAEEFTAHIRYFKLGTLVGSNTAGAANNDHGFPIAPFFVQSISVGRTEHPVMHGNWERIGLAPDVAAAPGQALAQAEVLALTGLLARPSDTAHREDYAWALVAADAALHPPRLDAAALAAYAGKYGARKIWLADGVLQYQREGREATTLTPLADDLFALDNNPEVRVRFRRAGGKIAGFDSITADGQAIPAARD
ncbi:MAG: S41 family peptidase [Rhizomicrobium sp.]